MPRLLADTAPLRVGAFRRLWWGLGISNLGTQLTTVAVGLQVYAITASTLAVGILGIFALVPLVVLGLYGGALVDQFDRRRVALTASTVLFVVTAMLALQAWLSLDSVWLLYVLVALQSAASAVNNPARSAIIPRLIPISQLAAANALQTLAWNVALTLGPLLGAVLVAWQGFGVAYTLDLLLFTASLYALWRLPDIPPEHDGQEGVRPRVAGWRSVMDGLRYLGTRPNLRMTFLLDLSAMILAMPRVLFPAVGVVLIGGGETTTGVLTAAIAVGAVLASMLSGGLTGVRAQGKAIVAAIAVFALAVIGFGVVLLLVGRTSPEGVIVWALVAACVLLAVAGAADSVSSIFRQTILQAATPDAMRGRLQGVFVVVVAGGPRLGDLVVGAEASWFGEGLAAVIGGVLCLVAITVLALAQRRFLAYDGDRPAP
ncbi:MFS transporter [Ruania alkalisoli]|uniref:MFS transporter n=1 Tax=Ruania alkalisoli TaxID=2779775 RepID=A0A7M1STF3_9MICO|nr:MFS transporter [Ruania alkalisoli]QOR70234.1 MFS transporter [Ruania alkalisoli]